jgi:hypothetical protein
LIKGTPVLISHFLLILANRLLFHANRLFFPASPFVAAGRASFGVLPGRGRLAGKNR